MQKTKVRRFLDLFHYWCGKLGVFKPIEARRDNRMDCECCVDDFDSKNPILRYNTKKILKLEKDEAISIIFHEIGHLLFQLPYRTYKQQVISECRAERFSLRMTKKYYLKYYKSLLHYTKTKGIKLKEQLYIDAYSQIKEYKNYIRRV